MLLKNALIVNEGRVLKGSVLIRDGLIGGVFPAEGGAMATPPQEGETLDLEGLYLLPGVIDDQVHFREPGFPAKADIASESRAAVAGGITSFMEMPNTFPQTVTQEALEKKFDLAREKSLANYSFYIGATNDNIRELEGTSPEHVCGIKVFMGSSTGNMLVDQPDSLARIFRLKKLPVAVHCEDEQTVRTNLKQARSLYHDRIPFTQHPVIRSHEACEVSSRLALSLALRYGTRLHLLHLSTAGEMQLLDASLRPDQKQVTAEVCVHHLWFSDRDYREKGGWIKWNPAIKEESDRRALLGALLDGRVDVIATDHAPHTREEKLGPYLECPSGGPMVQHALPAMLELVQQGHLSLERLVELMCHNPALCFGIRGRGFIREGYAADLVVVDPDRPQTVGKDNILYKCGWSPLEGTTLRSSVRYTFVNGILVYDNGRIHDGIRGQALSFSR
jgi:dihydroorotase